MRAFRCVACALLLVATGPRAFAQPVPSQAVDRRVRLATQHDGVIVGTVERVSADSLSVRSDQSGAIVRLAQTDVLRAEEAHGLPLGRSVKRGALVGAGIGAAALGVGLLTDKPRSGESMGVSNAVIALPAAVVLTLLGAAVGAWSSGETWQPVLPTRLSSTLQGGGALGVGVRLSF